MLRDVTKIEVLKDVTDIDIRYISTHQSGWSSSQTYQVIYRRLGGEGIKRCKHLKSPFRRIFRSFTTDNSTMSSVWRTCFSVALSDVFQGRSSWPLLSFVSLPQTTYLVIDNSNLLIQQVIHWLLLVKVVLMRRDRSRWQLPPDSLSECFTSSLIFMLPRVLWSRRS